ncbi:MAG: hypothetical protein PVH57_11070, partial [Syntrophobacterales bacterium]
MAFVLRHQENRGAPIDEGERDITKDMPQEDVQSEITSQDSPILVSREYRQTVGEASVENPRMLCRDVNVYYGDNHAIKNVSLD